MLSMAKINDSQLEFGPLISSHLKSWHSVIPCTVTDMSLNEIALTIKAALVAMWTYPIPWDTVFLAIGMIVGIPIGIAIICWYVVGYAKLFMNITVVGRNLPIAWLFMKDRIKRNPQRPPR
jgi:uncharacterized oligopeptide transporter (OPT) family protein